MTYSSLDEIPYKLFLKISETGNISLLSNSEKDIDKLSEIWKILYEEHLNKNHSPEAERIFKLSKEIDRILTKHKFIILSCESLRFDWDDEVVELIRDFRYTLRNTDSETYYSDIETIERESNGYILMANRLKEQLPKEKMEDSGDYNIDDVMASHCAILGYSIGKFNEITYTEHHAHQRSVNDKIKSIERQNTKK